MKKKQHRKTRVFSIIASLLMVFSLLTPGLVSAKSSDTYVRFNETSKIEKISSRLANEFAEDEKVSFLIKFKEKADTTKAVQRVKTNATKRMLSSHNEQFLQRSAVVSELKATAQYEQENVLKYLEQEKANGNVDEVKSFFIVNGISVTATKEVAEKLASFSEVEKILPNETRQLIKSTTTEITPAQKAGNVEWNVEKVGAPSVWDMGIDGTGVVVATIDSGVQWNHPAIKEKYRGYDAKTGEVNHNFNWFDAVKGQKTPYDDIAHGTHVTGTIVGSESDGNNKIGVAPGAKWIAVKAFSEDGGDDSDLLEAAEWILAPTDENGNTRVDLAPDIVNNSWSGGPGLDEWYRDVVIEWRNANIFPLFAAGNTTMFNPGGPESISSPANYPESFAVGATNTNNSVANFSLRGPSPYGEVKPDISAPGVNIRSSVPGGKYEDRWNGTSMAAPAVAGVIALLYEVNGSLTIDEVIGTLIDTAKPLTDKNYPETPNNAYGYGLINAYQAVSSIKEGLGAVQGNVVKAEAEQEPLTGTVSVVESRQSVNTNPDDGSYSLAHRTGQFTIEAEAYGYYPKQQVVIIKKDQSIDANFTLDEIPLATITGKITNDITGEAIEGAMLQLVDDANITPVVTNADGSYSLTAHEGTYTLKATKSGYHSNEVTIKITDNNTNFDVSLSPIFTYPGDEIGYDNGEIDNASMYYGSGAGWAVKMSLPEDKNHAFVTEGLFHFLDKGFSDTIGTDFNVEVWDATGPDGLPGEKLAGPIKGEAVLDGWTSVDLTEHDIQVNGDFYMVYVQTLEYPNAAGLGTDSGNPYIERSYQYLDGEFYPAFVEDGNYMIRAKVSYEVADPVIQSPKQMEGFDGANIVVEGVASPTTTIQLKNNNIEVGTAKIGEDGKFSIPVSLTAGDNKLIATSTLDGKLTGQSSPVTAVYITEEPIIEQITPLEDQYVLPGEVIKVTVKSNVTHGHANFEVKFPTQDASLSSTNNMIEVEPGVYEGSWTVPRNINIQNVSIGATITDLVGNKTRGVADGKLMIYQQKMERISGKDRYLTAIEISRQGWTKSDKVVLARGDGFADALAGVPFAHEMDAPILLTVSKKLGKETLDEINRLGAKEIIVLGGATAVSATVVKELEQAGLKVKRIAGSDRFETAAKIASFVSPNGTDEAVIVNGMDFPDALSVASHAATNGLPILLTQATKLPTATKEKLKELNATKTIVVGGKTVVSDAVANQLPSMTRLAGKDRYETNSKVAKHFGGQGKNVYVATGKGYADALTGAVFAAKNNSTVLLVHDRVPEVVTTYLTDNKTKHLTIFGGETAVSKKVASEMEKLLQ